MFARRNSGPPSSRILGPRVNRIDLYRDGLHSPWGIRLKGGRDVDGGTPLEITKIFVGSAAEGILFPGDKVVAINHQDTSRLTHMEAQNQMKMAGTNVQLDIVRPSHSNAPTTPNFPSMDHNEMSQMHAQQGMVGAYEPYRTAPLVTPTPKTLNDQPGLGSPPMRPQSQQSYHPPQSPMFDSKPPPAGLGPQSRTIHVGGAPKKVVSGQFNTPLNIYSDEAIAEAAIHNRNLLDGQSSDHPGFVESRHKLPHPKDATLSHPHQSETFKLILESELDKAKDHPKMFGSEFRDPPKDGRPNSQMSNKSADIDPVMYDNSINQSASFKRVMYSVMGETTDF